MKYTTPELEVVLFENEDIITDSTESTDPTESTGCDESGRAPIV